MRSKHLDRTAGQDSLTNLQSFSESGRRRCFVSVVFIAFSSGTYFLIEYDRLRPVASVMEQWARDVLAGRFPAPEQYRVGIPWLALGLERLTHLRVSQSVPLIEAISLAGALALLLQLLWLPNRNASGTDARGSTAFGLFLAAAQLPMLWVFPWERHETLPSAFYLSAMVYLVSRTDRRRGPGTLIVVLALAFCQSFARTDIPIITGLALVLWAAMRIELPRRRTEIMLYGGVSAAIGAAVQVYLQRVAYPNSRYPVRVPRIQLLYNLNPMVAPAHIPIFLTAVLPLFLTCFLAFRLRMKLPSSDVLILVLCALYLPVWATMGLLIEVRIYAPFLFLASPVIARVCAAYLNGEADRRAAIPG